jgi:GAF domain-containing protein
LESLHRAKLGGSAMDSPFVELLEVDGAAISTLGDLLGSETISASDSVAARVDEAQFDLGEGPCWDAIATSHPVSEPDLRGTPRWPAFREAISGEEIGAIFALPMVIGSLKVGAVDLYSRRPRDLDAESIAQGEAMANIVARHIFKSALARVGRDLGDEPVSPLSRRVLHQATGIVLAQMRLSASDARLVIEGHAFAAELPVMEVAQRIVDRELVLGDFDSGEDGTHG